MSSGRNLIPPSRRILPPVLSAALSLFLPGTAQVLNGQTVKGLCILGTAFCLFSATAISPLLSILLYLLMVAASSDAYMIATRMKLGEPVDPWAFLFFGVNSAKSDVLAGNTTFGRTLIAGASVYDGSGERPFPADVLLEGERISAIRPHLERKQDYRVVEAEGKLLMPGFLSPVACAENSFFDKTGETLAVRQGITTEILGSRGCSMAPVADAVSEAHAELYAERYGAPEKKAFFPNTGMYLMELDRLVKPVETESFMGYRTLRMTAEGNRETGNSRVTAEESRETGNPEDAEERLRKRVLSGLQSGAIGVSYDAGPEEEDAGRAEQLSALADAVREGGGVLEYYIRGTGRLRAEELGLLKKLSREQGLRVSIVLHLQETDTEEDVRDAMTELKALEAEARERKLPLLVCALNALGVPLYLPDHPADRSLNTRSLPELLAAELKTGDAERWISSATMKLAAFFRLWDRGLVREGMKADLVLVNPSLLPESEKGTIGGIEKVWVRGQLQIDALPELSDTIRSQTRVFGVRMPG